MAEFQVQSKTDFSGMLNASSSQHNLQPNQVLRLENMLGTEGGSLAVRDGAVTVDSGQFGTTAILTLHDLVRTDGTVYKLAVRRSASGQFLNRREAGTPWPQLGTFTTQYDLPTITTFANRAIIASGYEPIKYFDGTTFGSLTAGAGEVAPPGARHLAVHKGSLWAWNTAATTNPTDGPSSLRQSAVDNPNSWPLQNQTFLSNDDGQQGQGLATFTVAETGISPQAVLVAFKDFSTYIVNSTFAAAGFGIEKAKTDMGCVAPRSIQFLARAGIIRLTHRGFAIFDGLNDTVISDPIRPYLFRQTPTTDIVPLTWGQISRATATQLPDPPLYLCAAATGPGPELNRVFVYDLARQAWTILTFPTNFATLNALFDPGVQPYVLAGEQGGGRVQRLFQGDATDDGTPIAWWVRFQPLRGRALAQRVYVRRGVLTVADMTPGQTIVAQAVLGPAAGRVGPGTRTGLTTVDTRLTASSTIESTTEAELQFDVGRTGAILYYECRGQGKMVLRGVDTHLRLKPPSRPMRV